MWLQAMQPVINKAPQILINYCLETMHNDPVGSEY